MTTQTEPKLERHPIRGALWGLMMGLGVALILINFAVIAFGTWMPWIVVGVFIVLGVLWGMFGPAKKPRAGPSSATLPVDESDPAAPAEEPVADDSDSSGDEAG